jgi:putative membrane protein
MRRAKVNLFQLLIFLGVLMWSGIKPYDTFTWMLEVAPAVIGAVVLVATYKKFPLTPLTYWLVLIHAIILIIGGHYTYARVPFFNWLKDIFELERNNYDKLGHFVQGFTPAMIAREILLRKSVVSKGKWLFFIVISICMAISAFYELLEWWVALATGTGSNEFLGTQGYIWDTQSDMFYCLIGAFLSLIFFRKLHDRELEIINSES